MRYGFLSPFLQPQVLFTTNEPQSYVFGGRNHPLHINSQKSKDVEFYCAELVAPQAIRLERNTSENRLKHKASKNDLSFSRRMLVQADEQHRLESYPGEVPFENYIKIDNSHLPPEDAARQIKEYFQL